MCESFKNEVFTRWLQHGGHVIEWVRMPANIKLSDFSMNLVPFGIPNEYILYGDDYSFNQRQKEVMFSLYFTKKRIKVRPDVMNAYF